MIVSLFIFLYTIYLIGGLIFYDLSWFDYIDEIYPWMLLGLLILSKRKFSKPFLFYICLSIFYFIYSLIIRINTTPALLNDFIIVNKPYIAFFSVLCLKPTFTHRQIAFLRNLTLWCVLIVIIVGIIHFGVRGTIKGEILSGAKYSNCCVLLALSYYLFNQSNNKKARIITILICALGFMKPTSKYVVEFASLILLFYYISDRRRNSATKYFFLPALGLMAAMVVYNVIHEDFFYFTTDGAARGALFATAFDILNTYVPFGSGLASFATSASANWYSPIYAQFGIENVYGLVEGETYYASDTFFPVLAQFGYAGVILLVVFMNYIYDLAKTHYRYSGDRKAFLVGLMIVGIIVIESTSASSFIGNTGVFFMQLLALCLYDIRKPQVPANLMDKNR